MIACERFSVDECIKVGNIQCLPSLMFHLDDPKLYNRNSAVLLFFNMGMDI